MTKLNPQHLSMRLSASRGGRILLHLATLARSRKNFFWHLRCIVRELLNRPLRTARESRDTTDASNPKS